ncbi:Pre-mRNA-splicing factor syf2 [Leucoagaricus sp. SymC.cos]|nr:Pre-mRNA-splicing factor syf2 [Leucoagaricus sp. SymC.cos]
MPRARKSKTEKVVDAVESVVEGAEEAAAEVAGKAVEVAKDVAHAAEEYAESMVTVEEATEGTTNSTPESEDKDMKSAEEAESKRLTMEEREAKLAQLRKKFAASTRANRETLVEESAKAKLNAREVARLERQRKLAETLRLKADAEERGEDVERQKNWEWTIEDNDNWEKKQARKKRRADFEFHDDTHAARRKYKKDLDLLEPDLEAYNRQKALATSGALTTFDASGSSSAVQATGSVEQRLAHENLYRDSSTLIYGDNKPSEEAIDRVVGKINKDIDKRGKFSRKRLNEVEGDITYINEQNRVFNKKIARYYDKYTAEIRASFERGTAL